MIWSLASIAGAYDRMRAIGLRCSVFNVDDKMRTAAIAWFLEHANAPLVRSEERAVCYESVATLFNQEGRSSDYKQYIEKALHLREQLKENDIARQVEHLINMSDDYLKLDRPRESIAAARKGLLLLDPNDGLSAILVLRIARGYQALKEYGKAAENYDQAVSVFEKQKSAVLKSILKERADAAAHK